MLPTNKALSTVEPRKRLVTTKQAASFTGLSEYELRRGWKEGRYPALVIGRGDERRRLRWNLEALEAAIMAQMGAV